MSKIVDHPFAHHAEGDVGRRFINRSGGSNGGFWVNDRFEELMAEAETVTDQARLVEIMKECQQILTELDPPVIYLGQTQMYTALNPDIQGFVANPLSLEPYFPSDLSRG